MYVGLIVRLQCPLLRRKISHKGAPFLWEKTLSDDDIIILELLEVSSTPSLSFLLDPKLPVVWVSAKIPYMGWTDLFKNYTNSIGQCKKKKKRLTSAVNRSAKVGTS